MSRSTQRKIVFIYERLGQNKWFAPLVDEALSRELAVECWLDDKDISATTKWYEHPQKDRMPAFPHGAPVYRTFADQRALVQLIKESADAVVFCDRPPECEKPVGQSWIHVVTTYYDSFVGIQPERMNKFDLIFATTPHWVDMGLRFYVLSKREAANSPELPRLRKKIRTTGVPQFDHFFLLNKETAKKKLGIPASSKVVTVYTFEPGVTFWSQRIFRVPGLLKRLANIAVLPFSYPFFFSKIGRSKLLRLFWYALVEKPKFITAAFRDPSEADVLKAAREFCNKNGYFLVFKYRKKNPPEPYQAGIADLEISEDTDLFPYTSAQVVAASDLVITNYSTVVGEAVFNGVPAINLHPRDIYLQIKDQYRLLYLRNSSDLADALMACVHDNSVGAFYNFPGAVSSMSFNDFCREFPHNSLQDFTPDPARQQEYRKKYIQEHNGPVAKAVLDLAMRDSG